MIKLKKILKYANIVILTIIILLSSCLIGTPLVENNVQLIYIIAGIFSIAYFVYQIVKKKKIEINKIDIIVIMLAFSTFIPLISQKFVSLTETIHGIIKYFCILNAINKMCSYWCYILFVIIPFMNYFRILLGN